MLIAQITDTHVSTPGSRPDRFYDTAGHLARAVRHLNALKPDLVLHTGDCVDVGTEDEYAVFRQVMAPLQAPCFMVPGNHDRREAMRRALRADGYLPAEGFLQYTVEGLPLRLIGLDTLVEGETRGWLCQERLGWLEARLAEAPERPTLVFMHHPPFRTGLARMDEFGLEGADGLAEILGRHRQVLHLLGGHLHRAIVAGFGGTVATTSPATAHQIALELPPSPRLAVTMEPPAVTLLLWDAAAGTLAHHLSYVEDYPRHVLHDGTRWLGGAPPFAVARR